MNSVESRISYYVKKVAQFGAIHPSKPRNKYRHNRLMAYKGLLHKEIEKMEEVNL